MPGPPPTPSSILEMRGSRLAAGRGGEVRFERSAPPCPKCLRGPARREWKRLVKQLSEAGVLQAVDGGVLAAYCEAFAEFCQATEQLAATGLLISSGGRIVRNPLVMVKNGAADRVQRLAQQLGLSPSARTRLKADAPAAEEEGVVSRRRA